MAPIAKSRTAVMASRLPISVPREERCVLGGKISSGSPRALTVAGIGYGIEEMFPSWFILGFFLVAKRLLGRMSSSRNGILQAGATCGYRNAIRWRRKARRRVAAWGSRDEWRVGRKDRPSRR